MVRQRLQTPRDGLEHAARSLDRGAEPCPADMECMLQAVRAAIRNEDRSLAGYLRSRPTWLRRGLLLAALSVPVVPALVAGMRGDWGALRAGATAAMAAVLATCAIACAWLATRPLQRRGLTRGLDWALFGVAVAVMAGAALLDRNGASVQSVSATGHVACMGVGVLVALPAMVAGRLLHRGSLSAPLLTATAASLMANLGLFLRCPVNHAGHCLIGHVSVALCLALPLLLLRRLVR